MHFFCCGDFLDAWTYSLVVMKECFSLFRTCLAGLFVLFDEVDRSWLSFGQCSIFYSIWLSEAKGFYWKLFKAILNDSQKCLERIWIAEYSLIDFWWLINLNCACRIYAFHAWTVRRNDNDRYAIGVDFYSFKNLSWRYIFRFWSKMWGWFVLFSWRCDGEVLHSPCSSVLR